MKKRTTKAMYLTMMIIEIVFLQKVLLWTTEQTSGAGENERGIECGSEDAIL